MSFGARDGASVIRQQSYWIKFPLKHPPTQSQTRHNCQSRCFILFLYHRITETKLMRKMDANINQYDKSYFKLHLWGNLLVVYSEFSVRPRSSWNNWGEEVHDLECSPSPGRLRRFGFSFGDLPSCNMLLHSQPMTIAILWTIGAWLLFEVQTSNRKCGIKLIFKGNLFELKFYSIVSVTDHIRLYWRRTKILWRPTLCKIWSEICFSFLVTSTERHAYRQDKGKKFQKSLCGT